MDMRFLDFLDRSRIVRVTRNQDAQAFCTRVRNRIRYGINILCGRRFGRKIRCGRWLGHRKNPKNCLFDTFFGPFSSLGRCEGSGEIILPNQPFFRVCLNSKRRALHPSRRTPFARVQLFLSDDGKNSSFFSRYILIPKRLKKWPHFMASFYDQKLEKCQNMRERPARFNVHACGRTYFVGLRVHALGLTVYMGRHIFVTKRNSLP